MLDLTYLCNKISDMAGMPVRLYQNEQLTYFYNFIEMIQDPITPALDAVFSCSEHIGYIVSEDGDLYGILNFDGGKLVIGPSINANANDNYFHKKVFDLDIPVEQQKEYIQTLKTLVRMPLSSIMQILCTLNYVLNNEKSNLTDFSQFKDTAVQLPENDASKSDFYRSYNVEQQLCHYVESGDLTGFEQWLATAPTVRQGKLANENLRQAKNIFIVSATLFSRSAIEGGLDLETAFQLSDTYIQRCESLRAVDEISSLQLTMIKDFIRRVQQLKKSGLDSPLAGKVYNYVINHIGEAVTTEQLAGHLGFSRSYLSTLFYNQCGISLKDYIMSIKMEQAKTLLKSSDHSLLSISQYLGFSSPSHFSSAFQKHCGCSPSAYRSKYIV